MKTIWSAFTFFCVVQVLATAMFAGWLWQSGRLNGERVRATRSLFAQPAAPEDEDVSEAGPSGAPGADGAPSAADTAAQETIRLVGRFEQQQRIAARRLRDEHAQLSQELDLRAQDLRAREEELHTDRMEWEASVLLSQETLADEQFAKAVKLLGGLPPKSGKARIIELMQAGRTDQAVAYLNAMNGRQAGRILREFKSADEGLMATDLLERLRMFGRLPEPDMDPADANPDSQSPQGRASTS